MIKKTRNKAEAKLQRRIKKSGLRFEYEAERIPWVISGHYKSDFTIYGPSSRMIIEYKGYFRPADKRKMVAVKKCNPHLDIRIVFSKENKTNTRWCLKYGFPYAIETIPDHWLEELNVRTLQ